MMEFVAGYQKRTTGSDASNALATQIAKRLGDAGLKPVVEPFHTTVNGTEMSLQNVWAAIGSLDLPIILLVANRDISPLTTVGANANASGAAALMELARVYSLEATRHTMLFLWTDGDAYGGVGTQAFIDAHPEFQIVAAVNATEVATPNAGKVVLNGWSASDRVAPPWLWATAQSAAKAETGLPAPLPGILTQLMRLAVPIGSGSAAPLVAAGVPGISVSVAGQDVAPIDDTITAGTSKATLAKAGRAVERLVDTLDEQQLDTLPGSSSILFFSRYRQLPGAALGWVLAMLVLPILVIAVDSYAAARRARSRLTPAWLLYGLRLAPWVAVLVLVYLANILGLLPHSPGAAFLPDTWIAQNPRYLRMLVLLGLLIGVVLYAHAIERRVERRLTNSPGATLTVVHISLVVIAFFLLLVNPFSLILAVPAAIFWPLVRLGPWQASRLPAWAGTLGIIIGILYFAMTAGLGFKVWWYFFLLLENQTIPALAALLGAALIAGALHLGHHLYRPDREWSVRRGAATQAAAAGPGGVSGADPAAAEAAAHAGGETADAAGGATAPHEDTDGAPRHNGSRSAAVGWNGRSKAGDPGPAAGAGESSRPATGLVRKWVRTGTRNAERRTPGPG